MPLAAEAVATREPRRVERGPPVAGVELAAGAVRVVVGRREDGRLRVTGTGTGALPADAVTAGLVVDREAVSRAVRSAMDQAEGTDRSVRVLVALDGDEIRTHHGATSFERRSPQEPIPIAEIQRAMREAREQAARTAQQAATDDPSLRGIATVQLDTRVAGFFLDGRPLDSLEGFQGRAVVVNTDVSLAPLLHSGAATGACAALKRRIGLTSGAYALGRLLARSGVTDGAVLRLGADVTAYAILHEGRVAGTRVFGLGRDVLQARPGTREADAAVWAQCVLAAEGALPARWSFVGVPDELIALPRALGDALTERRGGPVDITPLRAGAATRLVTETTLHADHLVAAGAAALAAELY